MYKRFNFAIIVTLVALLAGCGEQPGSGGNAGGSGSGAGGSDDESGMFTVASSEIPKFGHYLGAALDDGRIRVAAPDKWSIAPRSSQYLAMFKRSKSLSFPRIMVRASDSPVGDFGTVTKDNVESFATRMIKHMEGAKIKTPVRPAVIGGTPGVIYMKLAKNKTAVVEQVIFASNHSGRLYEVSLTGEKGSTDDTRPVLYSVVAALEFVGAESPQPAVDPATDGSESSDAANEETEEG